MGKGALIQVWRVTNGILWMLWQLWRVSLAIILVYLLFILLMAVVIGGMWRGPR